MGEHQAAEFQAAIDAYDRACETAETRKVEHSMIVGFLPSYTSNGKEEILKAIEHIRDLLELQRPEALG